MISNKNRDNRRSKFLRMPKNLQRLYKEGKCAECSVVVTRMDFAKILGKFTKVKIQYEKSSTPKSKKNLQQVTSPNSRLKSNENGMVLLHRNVYSPHPVKELMNTSKSKINTTPGHVNHTLKENTKSKEKSATPQSKNVLKENNRLKKTPIAKSKGSTFHSNNNKIDINSNLKHYGIIFTNPTKCNTDISNKLSLTELLPSINKDILPSEEWCIDYFPKDTEPKDDKVYDRIAAQLENLMYNEKPVTKSGPTESKSDDFPSIMDILNDSDNFEKEKNQINPTEFKSNLESSDVEAMLLGKPNETKKDTETIAMDVDNSEMSNLIADIVPLPLNPVQNQSTETADKLDVLDNPNSPSILDETLQKGIEEHLPNIQSLRESSEVNKVENILIPEANAVESDIQKEAISETKGNDHSSLNISAVTHVVFKKSPNGQCCKLVTCSKNLKYSIELQGKSVEFLGAPKFVSSLEDLQVLLQIVDESDLNSLYVLH